ncbi:MAG: acyl-CoA thioesterase [Treponema sp.]|jgi:acyl-CoA thioester hydrolase|nr:acyl-CoA thioesterase [Treponema sp.]
MTCTTSFTVRPYECDSYRHVNNAVYLNYLEYARMDFLRQIGFRYNALVDAGFYLYVTHVDIYYKASAVLDDLLHIDTTSVKLGSVSGTMHQIIRKEDGTVCAEADVTWASVKDGRPSRIPAEFIVPGLKPEAAA